MRDGYELPDRGNRRCCAFRIGGISDLLIAGRPFGRFAWGGQHDVLPTRLRLGSGISILLYAGFAVIIVAKATDSATVLGRSAIDYGIWALAAYFVLGIFMNAVSRSASERRVMVLMSLVLAVACLLLAGDSY